MIFEKSPSGRFVELEDDDVVELIVLEVVEELDDGLEGDWEEDFEDSECDDVFDSEVCDEDVFEVCDDEDSTFSLDSMVSVVEEAPPLLLDEK